MDGNFLDSFIRSIYRERQVIATPYGYPVVFNSTIAASGNDTQSLSITANADFILTRIAFKAYAAASLAAGTTVFIPNVRLLITDQGSNEQYTSSAVDLSSYGYNALQTPKNLPYPRFVSGRTALTLQVSNADTAASVFGLNVTLEGMLIRQL
jgi:hypothetical protein